MTYLQGFVIAVPDSSKQAFIEHANKGDSVFLDHGAKRIIESWQEDVPKGHTTDFFGAVDCHDDEAIVFSWIEWEDKATHDAMESQLEEIMQTDDRFNPAKNPMPFDGSRMIYGNFDPILDEGEAIENPYIQGFIIPVPEQNKAAYLEAATAMWNISKDYGAKRVIEAWQQNVPAGQKTDFYRAVKAEPGEIVVFSFIEWETREACDAAHDKMMQDKRMQVFMSENLEMMPPFDGKRMVYGGFRPVIDLRQTY